jgi:hypothetical protein
MGFFDIEALIRACLIGLSVSAIGGYIVHRLTGNQTQKVGSRRLLILAAVGVGVLVAVGIYYAWPNPLVPRLDNLPQAEAEDLLIKRGLVPEARPQQTAEVEAGRVVPDSQAPNSGLRVRSGTVVTFGVSVSHGLTTPPPPPPHLLVVSLFQPRSGESLRCSAGGDGIYRCAVRGTSAGPLANKLHLLLWVKPVSPPSDQFGWYLERSGNGVETLDADGSWSGIVQVGNSQFPPHARDVIDVAVSTVDDETYRELMGRRGVVVEPEPRGLQTAVASNVLVSLR